MGNLGRYVCVAIPFFMTLASLAALLVAGLGGVTDKNMYMFQVNTTNLTISAADVSDLINLVTRDPTPDISFHDPALLADKATSGSGSSSTAVTGEDLGLYDLYDIGLWGYCYTMTNGTRSCTQTSFNWAENALNQTTSDVSSMITATGKNVTLPTEVMTAIRSFDTAMKWTEIVFIIAAIALAVEIFFGFLANCSRVFSCITWLVASVATVAVCASAALATATSAIVIGVLDGSAKKYGVTGSFNTRFLAAVWISAAFAIAAGLFWVFTCCCCAPDHSSKRRSNRNSYAGDREKLVPAGAYVPIHGDQAYNGAYGVQQHHYASGANGARRDVAYEPYSHQHHANV